MARKAPLKEEVIMDDIPEPPEPEMPVVKNVEIPGVPGVQLSKVVASVWFPDKPRVLLGEAEPKAEGEDEEATPEEPAEPKGPTKELLFEIIPTRILETDAWMAYNVLKKKVYRAEKKYEDMPKDKLTEEEEDERARVQLVLNTLKEEVAAAEVKYAEVKPTFEPDPLATLPWMNNLMDVAHSGVQTFVVGGAFWPCTDMMKLFAAKTHYDDSERLFTKFKARYATERTRPISLYHKLVPQIFQEGSETPIDYAPLINTLLRNTGQEADGEGGGEEEEGGAPGAQLDIVMLYWWDTTESDYVKACKSILATRKVKALGLVNFPLHTLKNIYRAGIDVAVLEVNWEIGALEKREYCEVLDYCQLHNIQVLYGDALVGGLLSCGEIGKLECPGEGFRKKLDPAGPEAVGKKLVEQFGGWCAFQRLLELIKAVGKKHDCNCSTVMAAYYVKKCVHPVVCIPWGPKCKQQFPCLAQATDPDFLDDKDMELVSAALCKDPSAPSLADAVGVATKHDAEAKLLAASEGLAKWYALRADEGEGAEGDLLHRLDFPVDSWDVMAGVLADPPAKGKEPVVGKGNLKVLMGISEEMRNHSAKIKLHLCGKQQPPEPVEPPDSEETSPPPPPEIDPDLLHKFKLEFYGEPVPQDATLFLATCRALSVKKWLMKGFGPDNIGHLKAITNPISCTGMYDESATCVDMKLTY